jgi:branched-chain amino acid transport system ATP-binding protein
MMLLSIDRLCKSFGTLAVTRDVTLSLGPGERHVVIGPNGAGKSSLLNQIGGQLRPDSGTVHLHGKDVTGLSPEKMCRLGVARTFQKNNLFKNLTVLENVRLAVQAKRGSVYSPFRTVARRRDLVERASAILDGVGLGARASMAVNRLSYGEQREVELACALAGEPILLLLDEPTSGLSHAETRRMIDRISALPRDIAILMIEHDLNAVFSIADRISVLHYGELIVTGTQSEVSGNARVREVYLGAHV